MDKRRFLLVGLVAVAALTVMAGQASAATILHFDDYTGGGNQVGQALTSLGETATVTSHINFATDLASQAWDLVIVDISSSSISGTNVSALTNYLGAGGKAIMSYWYLNGDPSLASAFEVSVASTYYTLQSVFAWDAGHAIFNYPSSVSSPVAFGPDMLGDNGDELNVLGGAAAVAGFVPSPTSGKAAIVIGNSGRTIVNGWSFDELSGANGIQLAANEINYLLNGAPNPVPEPSSLTLFGLSTIGMAIVAAYRRRSKVRNG